MIIEKYNVKLVRLTIDDIELLREKRNSDNIKKRMIYQKDITREEQLSWFKSIDNICNFYLLIHYKGEIVGIVNGKNADFDKKESEGGIFIWDDKYLKSILPALCSLIMHDYNFFICEFEKTYIKVLKNNNLAIKFNESFGYKVIEENEGENYYTCVLNRDDYFEKTKQYRKAISKIYNDTENEFVKRVSFRDVTDDDIVRLYKDLPDYMKEKLNMVLRNENRKLI